MRCPTHLSHRAGRRGGGGRRSAASDRSSRSAAIARTRTISRRAAICPAMIAEIYGKATGCARGKGGSMHLVDEDAGFMGSTAIVGGTVPVGVGLGLSQRSCGAPTSELRVPRDDAVAETGVFFESVELRRAEEAAGAVRLREQPLLRLLAARVRQPAGRGESTRWSRAMGLPAAHGDGNDARAVYRAVCRPSRDDSRRARPAVSTSSQPTAGASTAARSTTTTSVIGPKRNSGTWKAREPDRSRLERRCLRTNRCDPGDSQQMQADIDARGRSRHSNSPSARRSRQPKMPSRT